MGWIHGLEGCECGAKELNELEWDGRRLAEIYVK